MNQGIHIPDSAQLAENIDPAEHFLTDAAVAPAGEAHIQIAHAAVAQLLNQVFRLLEGGEGNNAVHRKTGFDDDLVDCADQLDGDRHVAAGLFFFQLRIGLRQIIAVGDGHVRIAVAVQEAVALADRVVRQFFFEHVH